MAIENPSTTITVGEAFGDKRVANITLEGAKFWGRPNFAGELDRFKDARRKFTILIPNEIADDLRALGWNVKTKFPNDEDKAQDPEAGPISSMKVMLDFSEDPKHPGDPRYEKGSVIWCKSGENVERLNSRTAGMLDRARIIDLDMELRAWMYNKEEVEAGVEEPMYSARVVELVATIQPNRIQEKHGLM